MRPPPGPHPNKINKKRLDNLQPWDVWHAGVTLARTGHPNDALKLLQLGRGSTECDGSGRLVDYADQEPFVTMDQALSDGRVRVYCLGLTLDALTLCGDPLTKHQQGFTVVHPSSLPLACGPRTERGPLGQCH